MDNITEKSRQLRKNMTTQEKKLWNIIRNRQFFGFRFRRQFPIGNYIVDFICREKNIIIELDGGQHNENINIVYDNKRTEFLVSEGFKVVRFWNNEIDENIDGVYERLKEVFGVCDYNMYTPPQPSPTREGEQLRNFHMPPQFSQTKEGEQLKNFRIPPQPFNTKEGVQLKKFCMQPQSSQIGDKNEIQ
ncbi:endonuclease domain-containing protein [bacterium]|nr:endonuclease domain-containing protein [bacterium]